MIILLLAGLAVAWYLSHYAKQRCLIIDREKTIGGCHRVRRVNGFFSEHGPRIYSDAYVNALALLNDMGIDFFKMFTRYTFGLVGIGRDVVYEMYFAEILAFVKVFLWSEYISQEYAKSTTMKEFMKSYNFSDKTFDTIDRVCQLTDGAGAERYTLFEFLQLLDQNVLYQIYQPKSPNDVGLFPAWEKALLKTGKVDIVLDTHITNIIDHSNMGRGNSNIIVSSKTGQTFSCRKGIILAIPPKPLVSLNTPNLSYLKDWEIHNRYDVYIPIIFHYDSKFHIDNRYGSLDRSDWGIAYIIMTNHTNFENPQSKTVITTCITNTKRKSKFTGKTADESNREELVKETLRQLRQVYPDLPDPTVSIVSPGIFKSENGKQWDTIDDSYIRPVEQKKPFIDFKLSDRLWTVGTHTGHHYYDFTSMESAVTNGLFLCKTLYPTTDFPTPKKPIQLSTVLLIVVLIVFLLCFFAYFRYF